MLVFTLFDPMKQTIASLFVAVGRPMTVVTVRLFQLAVMIAGLYLMGKRMGIAGVALAVDLMLVLGIMVVLWLARRYVDFSLKEMLMAPLLGVGAGIGLTLGVESFLPPIQSLLLSAVVDVVLFTFGYGVMLLLFDRENTRDLIFLLNKYVLRGRFRRSPAGQADH